MSNNIHKFATLAGLIKKVKRSGWLRYLPAQKVQSVGDHSARIAMMAMCLRNVENINYSKCMEMALIHDIGEGIVGDYTPYDKITPQEKFQKQKAAIEQIFEPLGEQNSKYFISVWMQYQKCQTYEARIVKDLDKYEMIQQAWEYEQSQGVNLSQFYDCVSKFKTDLVKKWAMELLEERKKKL